MQIAEFTLRTERDANLARRRAQLLASLVGLSQRRRASFARAVKELARHIVRAGKNGTVTFAVADYQEDLVAEAVVRAGGTEPHARPSPEQLPAPAAVADGVLEDAKQWVDHLSISTDSAGGTVVRLCQMLPDEARSLVEAEGSEWGTVLAAGTTQGALVTSQRRIRELREKLLATRRYGVDLEQELREIKALNETLELLALVASKTDNAVIILGGAGDVEWVNDSFTRLTGVELADIRGRSILDVWYGSHSAERGTESEPPRRSIDDQRDVLRRALTSGHGVSQEIRRRRTDGAVYWAAVSLTPVFDDAGHVTRWIGIANDVTKWHETQETLQRAKEAAEAASQLKGEFLANMSHEIRTPMNVIIGMTELTLATVLAAEQREYLTAVKSSADALLWLLNDILDLSKIEAGKLQLEATRFRLSDLLSELLKPLEFQARTRGLSLSWQLGRDTPGELVGDPGRLRQILLNLVSNAIKFTPAGEIDISVESQRHSGSGCLLHFAVRDTGIGISSEKLHSIFDMFTQADSSTTRRYGGTGLGLNISSQLVAMMHGRLWAESEVGRGSTFHFTVRLPVPEGPARRDDRPEQAIAAAGHRLRVLVVDDNPPSRLLAARILEKRGHEVLQAENGGQALEIVDREPLNVVVMDAQMPEMDGFQATAAIRERERTTETHLPIIALTASAMKGDRERCLAAGMDGYLAKPISARDLEILVETLGAEVSMRTPRRPIEENAIGHFDFSAALARLEGDEQILQEQMQLFLADSPSLLARVNDAIAAGEAELLRTSAHRLKGFAATLDAKDVVEKALQLERMGHEGDMEDAKKTGEQLKLQMERLWKALQCFLAGRK
jgi:PAS domain S-box-containing protein